MAYPARYVARCYTTLNMCHCYCVISCACVLVIKTYPMYVVHAKSVLVIVNEKHLTSLRSVLYILSIKC